MSRSHIAYTLWQGSAPTDPTEQALLHRQFDAVVLCAEEYQPDAAVFPGMLVLHAGFDDSGAPPTGKEIAVATRAGRNAARLLAVRRRVLVTCWLGLNRSGLVSALALHGLTGMSGQEAAGTVRRGRPGALNNAYFARLLEAIPARQVRAPSGA